MAFGRISVDDGIFNFPIDHGVVSDRSSRIDFGSHFDHRSRENSHRTHDPGTRHEFYALPYQHRPLIVINDDPFGGSLRPYPCSGDGYIPGTPSAGQIIIEVIDDLRRISLDHIL